MKQTGGEAKRSRHEEGGGGDDSMLLGALKEMIMKVDLAEVYSSPRVTKEVGKFKLKTGEVMDLTTAWAFSLKVDRDRAENI